VGTHRARERLERLGHGQTFGTPWELDYGNAWRRPWEHPGNETTSFRKSTQVRWIAKGSLTGSECESVSDSSESCARMTATMGLSFVTERCVFKKSLDNEHIFVGISSQTRHTRRGPTLFCPRSPRPGHPPLFLSFTRNSHYNGAFVCVL